MMRAPRIVLLLLCGAVVSVPPLGRVHVAAHQTAGRAGQPAAPAPTLGLEHGTLDFDTPAFTLKLVKDSQTIAALQPKGAKGRDANTPFDFTPADQLSARQGDRFNHLGDVTLRVKSASSDASAAGGGWIDMASSDARKPITALASIATLPRGTRLLAAADLTPTLPASSPLQVTRSWQMDASGHLVLHFDLKNKTTTPVTIGGLGFPVVFNNMIQNFVTNRARTLPEAHEICSFFDPYVGRDAGYLQVTRLSGAGPALLLVPEPGTRTPFEAFRSLNDASRRGQTFEGAFEWTVASQGYAGNEWKNAQPWNAPTSVVLKPGETRGFGLQFLVADEIRQIERTLGANDRPVAVGVPGYIVPMDIEAKLLLTPGKRSVRNVLVQPAGALSVTPTAVGSGVGRGLPAPAKRTFTIRGLRWGRVRLIVNYSDGMAQSIHYYVTKPAQQAVADMGTFLTTKAWYTDESDPFRRAPSPMTYDRANNRIVLQDTRAWVAGLSDEGGTGAWLAAMMKIYGQPNKAEVDKLSQFVDRVIWGNLQYSDGPRMYGVKKSLFFYQPDLLPNYTYQPGNWSTWTSWNKSQADAVDRAYDYPHVVAAYWSMYRLARNYTGLVSAHPWEWYLDKAFNTVKYMTGGFAAPGGRGGVGYVNVGLMDGDIFVMLLDDLKRENWTEQASYLEAAMKRRADRWNADAYPFGSEMAWDSTGQEEIYAWTDYFGYKDKAVVSLNSILGYMPTVPHWGYNGNARRYWDFFYGAAPGGTTERQIHHYGSGINAIPMLGQFRQHPDDTYLLRVGYGGAMGAIAAIDQEGFPSAAFHSYPQTLRWDSYTGDYGPNFFGHAVTTATYVVNDPALGWQAFGGNLRMVNGSVEVQTLDSLRRRIYLAPVGLYLTLDAGTFESVRLDPSTGDVRATLSPSNAFTPSARLRIEQPAKTAGAGTYRTAETYTTERGALVIPLQHTSTNVLLKEQ